MVPLEDEQPQGLIPETDVQVRIRTMLANREFIIKQIKPLLIEGIDIYTLPGMKKPSLGKPGAEKLATIFNLTGKFEVDKETMELIGATANGKPYIAFVCNLSSKGRVAGQGRGATIIEYMRNSYDMIFERDYNALSAEEQEKCQGPLQGVSKKDKKPYTYWRRPAPPVNDPLALNKAIKMAQKSAFVDAVIRATGMSDLFTQDIEDGGHDSHNEREEEPFAGTPAYSKPAAPKAEDTSIPCGSCNGYMKKRNGQRGPFYGCSNWPKCNFVLTVEEAEQKDTTTFDQHQDEIKKD